MDNEEQQDENLENIGQISITSEEMTRTGSVACLSKKTITGFFDSSLSCSLFIAAVYIGLLATGLAGFTVVDKLFYTIGYISLAVLITVPIGLYGSISGSYSALICFFLATSYLLYALTMYIWFNARTSTLFIPWQSNTTDKGFQSLHQLACISYTITIVLSLLLAVLKIVSNVSQLEPARVIVVDNNPLD